MRTYAVSTLFLVFVLLTGACAGRQARTASIPAPPRAEIPASVTDPAAVAASPDAVEAPIVEPVVVETAPVTATEEPALTTQQMIDKYVAEEIAAHNAANRAAAEKLHRIHVPETLPHNDEIVAALGSDPSRMRRVRRETGNELAQALADVYEEARRSEPDARPSKTSAVAYVKPRPKPKAAHAAEDDGREAAVGRLAIQPPSAITPSIAAPSVQPAPRAAADAPASAGENLPIFVPDRAAVEESRGYWGRLLLAALAAGLIGVLFGLLSGIRQRRALRAAEASDAVRPDGVYIEEVVAGRVVSRIFHAAPPQQLRSEPEAHEQAAMMDEMEKTWQDEGDAMDGEDARAIEDTHDRFDVSDTPIENEEVPSQPPPTPAQDDSPRFASGSGQMISSSDDVLTVSGVAHVPDPPQEPRSEPEAPAKVIIFEDDSSNAAAAMAAPTAPN